MVESFLLSLFLTTSWPSGVALSPSGDAVAFVAKKADLAKNTQTSRIWLWRPGEAARPLTYRAFNASSPAFSPDGKTLAFISTRDGGAQIWLLPVAAGGEARRLTRLPTEVAGPLVFSPDGRLIAFTSEVYPDCADAACNQKRLDARAKDPVRARLYTGLLFRHWNAWRGARRSHLFVVPLDGSTEPRDLTPGPHDVPPIDLGGKPDYDFSPDSKRIAYTKNTASVVATSTNNDLFEVSVDGGEAKQLTTHPGNDHSPRYSPDGKSLAYLSMARAGYEADRQRILVRELASGAEAEWAKDFAQPQSLQWNVSNNTLQFTTPLSGQNEVFAASPDGAKSVTRGRYVHDAVLSRDGKVLAFVDEAANRAPEVVAMAASGEGEARTTTLNASSNAAMNILPAEHHTFAGAGGAKVHGVLVKPRGFEPGRKYPALVIVHGGPQGQSGNDFHPRWNLASFASMGFVVFAINFHGSTGFGQAFTDAIRDDWGGKPYEDVLKGTDYLAGLPFVDGARIGAAGASYGGYLINWMMGKAHRFKCFVSHASVFDLTSKWGSTEELWFPEWEFKGTPMSNRARYRELSPSSYIEHAKTPTLVVHGALDYRVPLSQGLQLFTSLQRVGVPSKFLHFPDEGHFVTKPRNIELWWNTVRAWLSEHLLAAP